jgi:antitoxin (DNA-binding transcriptional repressor) of toxin-antitoxin stability system
VADVTIGELRNHGSQVMDRVAHGEDIIITRDGHPVPQAHRQEAERPGRLYQGHPVHHQFTDARMDRHQSPW